MSGIYSRLPPSSAVVLSSSTGVIAVSGALDLTNLDPYSIRATNQHLILSCSAGSAVVLSATLNLASIGTGSQIIGRSTTGQFQLISQDPNGVFEGQFLIDGQRVTAYTGGDGSNSVSRLTSIGLGIGREDPTERLTVSGNINLSFPSAKIYANSGSLILSSSATSIVRVSGNLATNGFSPGIATKVFADSPYSVTLLDYTILGNCTAGVVSCSLPDATTCQGRIYNFKKTDAVANNFCLVGFSSQNIDGSPLLAISTQYQTWTIQASGSGWYIL